MLDQRSAAQILNPNAPVHSRNVIQLTELIYFNPTIKMEKKYSTKFLKIFLTILTIKV